jgi:hypothetical protein
MKKLPSFHAGPDQILVVARGYLSCSAMPRVRAAFYLRSESELFPGMVEAWVEIHSFELAASRGVENMKVELCDLQFRCHVAGYHGKVNVMYLLGASFFRGVARAQSARGRPHRFLSAPSQRPF